MQGIRIVSAAALSAFCLIVGVMSAGAEPPPDEATPMYERGAVAVIDLTLPPASLQALEDEPHTDVYQPGTFSLAFTDGTPGGVEAASTPMEVGIRLKGKQGSFRELSQKAGFKLKLNFVKGKKFLGLKKMTLNNMVQDPSMVHETLSYELFRAAGVPSPRTGYAYVRVNGEAYGVYLNVETLDDVALERWFGEFDDPQHLYEGEYKSDVTPGGEDSYEVDEGDPDDRSDLEALIAAVAGKGTPFSERVAGFADLEEMTRMWAVEKYVGHWDGYAGAGPTLLPHNELPNNYYLFSDAAGEFQMLPWGTDQTWAMRLGFDAEAGLLFDECLADPTCWALYRESLVHVAEAVEALNLDAMAQEAAELLGPWQELAAPREEYDLGEVEAGVEGTRDFIVERPLDLAAWLKAHPLTQPTPPGNGDAGAVSLTLAEPLLVRPAMRVEGIAVDGTTLVTRLRLRRAGTASQRARIRTVEGVVEVCVTREQVAGAGRVTLRCELSATARRHLSVRWLRLGLRTAFEPVDGKPGVVLRRVHIPRADPE